jgi:crotonobetainyl-CoA:carnitine CoA-transferase CaiB-like acyl-CoA transferase
MDADELLALLRAQDVPAAPVLAAHYEYSDEFLTDNDFMHTVDDSSIGPCTVMRHYVSFPDRQHLRGAAPQLGEHNATILVEQ